METLERYRKGGHVLVVDDDEVNRELLRAILEAEGYLVSEAVDGQSALQAAMHDVDMVLLDFMMPYVDGAQVCRQLKKNPATASIPVIMVSACTARDVRLQGIAAGADDFLNKPVDIQEVVLRVRNAVAVRRLFREVETLHHEVSQLRQLVPMCSYCKRIRDESNHWDRIEKFISESTGQMVSHGICPDCYATACAEAGVKAT